MAQHVLEGMADEGRSVLWAHNGHVSRGGMTGWDLPSMGQHLAAALGGDYVALGFVFGHGRISAYNDKFEPGVHAVPRRTDPFHQALADTGSLFALDLRRMPTELQRQLEEKAPLTWEVGHTWYGPEAHERQVELVRSFDVIVYVDEVTPSRPYRAAFDA